MNSEQLLGSFASQAVVAKGGALYYPVPVALEVIAKCQRHELAVIGVEGNQIEGGRVLARSDLIFDLSRTRSSNWREYCTICNREAERIIIGLAALPGLALWLTILDEQDWK